jgi:hypothetical protein
MNLIPRFLLISVLLGGCAPLSPLKDKGGATSDVAADGSFSPIPQGQVWKIAKAMIAEREGWPERQVDFKGLIHVVAYSSRRINDGGYRVEAHRAITTAGHGDCAWDSTPPVVFIVNKEGAVIHYERLREQNKND